MLLDGMDPILFGFGSYWIGLWHPKKNLHHLKATCFPVSVYREKAAMKSPTIFLHSRTQLFDKFCHVYLAGVDLFFLTQVSDCSEMLVLSVFALYIYFY